MVLISGGGDVSFNSTWFFVSLLVYTFTLELKFIIFKDGTCGCQSPHPCWPSASCWPSSTTSTPRSSTGASSGRTTGGLGTSSMMPSHLCSRVKLHPTSGPTSALAPQVLINVGLRGRGDVSKGRMGKYKVHNIGGQWL